VATTLELPEIGPAFMKAYDHARPSGNANPGCKRNRLANIGLDCRKGTSPIDLDLLTDRDYQYLFETSDDGWLIGGGEDAKLVRPDTAHAETWRFGPGNVEHGGIPFDTVDAVAQCGLRVPAGCGRDHVHVVVERYHAGRVVWKDVGEELPGRLPGVGQLLAGHGARPVQHDRQVQGHARAVFGPGSLDPEKGSNAVAPGVPRRDVVEGDGGVHGGLLPCRLAAFRPCRALS